MSEDSAIGFNDLGDIDGGIDPDSQIDIVDGEPPEFADEPEPEVEIEIAPAPADERYAKLEGQVSELTATMQALMGVIGQPAPAPQEPEVEEEAPDLSSSPADEYVRWHAKKAMGGELAEVKAQLKALTDSLAPMQRRDRFVNAYHSEATALNLDPKTMAGEVARLMETDEDIAALADENPKMAARMALRMAQATAKPAEPAPAATPRVRKRPSPRPGAAGSPSRVASAPVAGSFHAAIQQTLREAGVPDGADFRFDTATSETVN